MTLAFAIAAAFVIGGLDLFKAQGADLALIEKYFGSLLLYNLIVVVLVAGIGRVQRELNGSIDQLKQVIRRREAVEASLLKSEARLRQMFDNNVCVLLLIDPESGVIVDANATAASFYGYPIERLRAMRIADIQTQGSTDADTACARAVNLKQNHFISSHRLSSGEVRTVETWPTPTEIDQRTLLICIVHDVTERHLAQDALRESQTRLSAVFEGSPIGITVNGLYDGRFLDVNAAALRILGYKRDEVIGVTSHALDIYVHPEQRLEGVRRMRESLRVDNFRIDFRHKSGTVGVLEYSGRVIELKGEQLVVGMWSDVSARLAAEKEINTLAFYDPLTHLPNRRLVHDRLRQALASGRRSGNHGALLFIDLDNFKTLNDTLGHDVGDLLLQQVAQRVMTCVREGDTVARLGGDEFLVMLEHLDEGLQDAAAQATCVGEKILAALNQHYQLASYPHHSTPSIGITLFSDGAESIDDLLKQADLAMYQAKEAGRNAMRFFDPQMQAAVTQRAALESDLRYALLKDQFVLHYQPQVVGHERLTGVEALLRWQHPERGIVSPAEFIPLAEDTGLIIPLGRWVLQTACRQLAQWAELPHARHLMVAVNVSPRQFRATNFVDEVLSIVAECGCNPSRLKLELTESLLVDDVEDVIAKMTDLKAKGVGFSLDDFGTGFSSLSYLKRLPLDQLKIDQGFVRDILTDANDAAIAKMVIALAESMGLSVIAEGVEIEAQRDFLARIGCYSYQGYLIARPMPLDQFEAFLERRRFPAGPPLQGRNRSLR